MRILTGLQNGFQMGIQRKLMLLVFLVLLGTTSAVVWKTRGMLVKDKLQFVADSAMKQMAPLKRLVKVRLDEQRNNLVKFASGRAAVGAGKVKIPSAFDAVAMVQVSERTQWQPLWIEKSPQPRGDLLNGYELTLLKSLPYARVRDGDVVWARASDRRGSPIYVVMFSVAVQSPGPAAVSEGSTALPDSVNYAGGSEASQKAYIVGLTGGELLADVTDDYIGSTNSVYLIDDKGYVAAHVNKSYLGALFTEEPIVAEIVNTKKTAASGNYEDLESHAVLGHFERIDGTNLYAIIATPLATVQAMSSEFVRTAMLTAILIGALGLLVTWFFGRSLVGPLEEAIAVVVAANRGESFKVEAVEGRDEIGTLMRLLADSSPAALASKKTLGDSRIPRPAPAQSGEEEESLSAQSRIIAVAAAQDELAKVKRQAYHSFKEGLASAIREPLLSILGHAQLTKVKAADDEIRAHAESVEREARRAKDVLEKMDSWAVDVNFSDAVDEDIDLAELLDSLLKNRESELEHLGVSVSKILHDVPTIRGSAERLRRSLNHLVDNALEAMVARPKKQLRVELEFLNDRLYLVIADSGVGMSRDIKERAFEPFYKAFENPSRIGLGLATVHSVIEKMGGLCEIESTPGEGTIVTVKIPVSNDQKQIFRAMQASRGAPVIESKPAAPPPPPAVAQGAAELAPKTEPSVVPPPVERPVVQGAPDSQKVKVEIDGQDSAIFAGFDDDDDLEKEDFELFEKVSLAPAMAPQKAEETGASISAKGPFDTNMDELPPVVPPADEGSEFKVRIRRPRMRSS